MDLLSSISVLILKTVLAKSALTVNGVASPDCLQASWVAETIHQAKKYF